MSDVKADLMERTVEFIKGLESVSAVNLQRQFRLTYMMAAKIMDELIARKLVSSKRDKLGRHQVTKKAFVSGEVFTAAEFNRLAAEKIDFNNVGQ